MHTGKFGFAQVMEHRPLTTFRRCVARHRGEHKVKRFSCLDQYLCMAFGQLTYRESCATSKHVCACKLPNCITWGSAAMGHATPWPMPMPRATDASTASWGRA